MRRLQPAAPPALGFHIVAISGHAAWERAQALLLEQEQAWASRVRLRWRSLLLEPRSTSSRNAARCRNVGARNGAPVRTGILHSRCQGQTSGLQVLFSISHRLASSSLDKLFVQRQTRQFSKRSYSECQGQQEGRVSLGPGSPSGWLFARKPEPDHKAINPQPIADGVPSESGL